jgi:hypothetical protein
MRNFTIPSKKMPNQKSRVKFQEMAWWIKKEKTKILI